MGCGKITYHYQVGWADARGEAVKEAGLALHVPPSAIRASLAQRLALFQRLAPCESSLDPRDVFWPPIVDLVARENRSRCVDGEQGCNRARARSSSIDAPSPKTAVQFFRGRESKLI